jgi:hypothetical protein
VTTKSTSDAVDQGTATMSVPSAWREGDELIDKAFLFVAERYRSLSWTPAVVGEEWTRLEAVIDEAYTARDLEQLLQALRGWARFALSEFKRPATA